MIIPYVHKKMNKLYFIMLVHSFTLRKDMTLIPIKGNNIVFLWSFLEKLFFFALMLPYVT